MTIFLLACCILSLCYLAATLYLCSGLKRLSSSRGQPQNLSFSIVIAAHNEESNIEQCLAGVLSQGISPERFEVIVVDDRSIDRTGALASAVATRNPCLSIITIAQTPPGVSPKKHAVMEGIKKARNPIIVFTDADCRVKPSWLETIDGHFTPRTGLVQGMTAYVREKGGGGAFFGIQALDFLSHGIVAAAAIGRNFPLNSNANNFAFRKEAFDDAGGYGGSGGVVSGDDDLLLQRVWKSGKWDVRYMADPAGAVETFPAPTFSGMFEQRKRWGSKTVHYNAGQVAFLGGIFCFYLMILVCCLAAIFYPALWIAAGAMLLVKLLGESVLLLPGTRIFDKKELRRYIVPASLLQLPMVVGAVLMGVFGRFGWKGQRFGRRMKRQK